MNGWEAALYLENGALFQGMGFGARSWRGGEAVFNTGMTGYQEIFTDPSYCQQVVVMTYPHIGNTGVNPEDPESQGLDLSGVVVRDWNETPANWRASRGLGEYLAEAGVPGICGVDTRAITRVLRDEGAQRCVIFPEAEARDGDLAQYAIERLREVPSMAGLELVSRVSCRKPYVYEEGPADTSRGTFAVYDFGVKTNTLRSLRRRGFRVKVVPHDTAFEAVLADKPVGVMLSNGPGDPSGVGLDNVQGLVGRVPIFAICMGHQLLARVLGCRTYKLKFGHHGVNHPVKDLATGRVLITSQNHGFAVSKEDLGSISDVVLSHVSLNDGTVEGFRSEKLRLLSVQFHPEAAPGPSDAQYLFDEFVKGFIS